MASVLLTRSCKASQKECSRKTDHLEEVMDSKWNNIVDNTMVRIGMLVVGFGAWLAIGYRLLAV